MSTPRQMGASRTLMTETDNQALSLPLRLRQSRPTQSQPPLAQTQAPQYVHRLQDLRFKL